MPTPETNPAADDPVNLDPKHYSVEFENDRVLVLRVKYGPKEKSVMPISKRKANKDVRS